MMKNLWFAVLGAVVFTVTGCMSGSNDRLSPADISLAELEKKMAEATDPQGLFAASSSYLIRQEVIIPHWLEDDESMMVEVKFEKPNKFAITTYKDNKPEQIICSNGKRAWMVNCKDRKELPLDKKRLRNIQMLSSLGRPGPGGYASIFKKVEVHKAVNEDGEFYRISCYGDLQKEPVFFYIGTRDFLLRRASMKLRSNDGSVVDYDNRISDYESREGVMINMRSTLVQNGEKQLSKVIYYKLNPKFSPRDFIPPVL